MGTLLALDLPLGPLLESAVRRCVEAAHPFCVLDQRLSPRRRGEDLDALGASAVLSVSGEVARETGRSVDDEIGLVMLTSGSSGRPKAAEISWGALRASATITQDALRGEGRSVWFPCLPANHIGGLAVLLRAVFADASLLWGENDDLETGAARGATHVSVVRTQLARHDLRGYRKVLLGGGRPPNDVTTNVVTTWGMTETGSGIVYDGVPLPDVDVAEVGGELIVRTPTLFRSYRDRARPIVKGPDGRSNWFPTGDAGEVRDGRVRVFGRLQYVINTGGEKIWPEDLEVVLAAVDGVRDVAVTGVVDPEWGQRVVALVVSDGRRLDDALRVASRDQIGPWASPKEIRHVVAIPRTGNGKIRRGDLAHLY